MNVSQRVALPKPAFLNGQAKRLLINGKWVGAKAGKTFGSINPATGAALDELALGDAHDVDLAVAAARRAFEGPWSKFRPAERQAVMLKLANLVEENYEELALLDTLDMGVPLSMSRYMKGIVAETFRFAAGQSLVLQGDTIPNSLPWDVFSYTLREPVGVVGGIVPWNGPVFNATWKIAPVLATGCTLVLKVAEQASLSPLRLGELCLEAGVPPGVINHYRLWRGRGCCTCSPSRCRQNRLHRFNGNRPAHHQGFGRQRQTLNLGTGRQIAGYCVRGCKSGRSGTRRGNGGVR